MSELTLYLVIRMGLLYDIPCCSEIDDGGWMMGRALFLRLIR